MLVILSLSWIMVFLLVLAAYVGMLFQHAWKQFHKIGMLVHLKWHLSLLRFKFSFLHICNTLHSVLSWSVPLLSYCTIKYHQH